MLASIFSLNVIQTALELGCIYALVALALFLSYSILNIADLSTDGCFTLGCAVACQVALTGHPILALAAAMAAGYGGRMLARYNIGGQLGGFVREQIYFGLFTGWTVPVRRSIPQSPARG